MRICLYTETALPKVGGQEMVVDALARQFQTMGLPVMVLAPHPRLPLRARDESLPYQVVRHPRFFSTRFFVDWYRWWLLRAYRRSIFDVLHCHGLYPPAYLASLCQQRLPVPVLVTSHGGDVFRGATRQAKPVVRRRQLQAIRSADALVSISRYTEEGFLRWGADRAQIVSIPNGVDLETLVPRVPRPADLDPAIEPGRYVFFIGRLKRRKGVDLLLEALTHVPAIGKVQLVVAGDGEEMPHLLQQAQQYSLQRRVCFVGRAVGTKKSYLLQNALCTVVPSRTWEAFGLVVLESYAAGTPVLATQVPGLGDLIEPGQTGWLVPPEQPAALAEVLKAVFQHPERCRELGRQAAIIAQGYSWRHIAERHVRLYEKLLEQKLAPAA